MAWISVIDERDASPELAAQYKRGANPDGTVDNVLKVHSLSPESLRAHLDLYITAMHRPSPLTKPEREIVGTIVSRLNGCEYCATHHAAGLRRLLPEGRKPLADALLAGDESSLTPREAAMAAYAHRLTSSPVATTRADVSALRSAGLTDREILDLAQVVAYFCYANRMVSGLGAELESFPPGQHPTVE